MVQLTFIVCIFLPSCVAADDDFNSLVKKASAEKNSVRLDAMIEIGDCFGQFNEQQEKEAAAVLVNAMADPVGLVKSAARMKLAEHAATINKHLGPFVDSSESLDFAKACDAIKSIGPIARIWIPQLEKRLGSSERIVNLSALHALGALDGNDLLPLIDKVIPELDSKDFNIQLSACRVISKIGPDAKKAGPRLVKLMDEGIASSRSWASIALGAIGPHEEYDVVKLLEKRLDMFYLIDRQRALEGLALMGPTAKSTLPKISKLMQDPSRSVQHTASRTYWKISGDAAPAVKCLIELLPTMEYGADSMDILAEMQADAKGAIPALVKELKSPEVTSREAAIYALAAIGPVADSAIEPLKKMNKDKDPLIRAAAEFALKQIQTPVVEK